MVRRYEQSIRVITAFYAVLLGFELRNLLDNRVSGNDRWLLVTLASFSSCDSCWNRRISSGTSA